VIVVPVGGCLRIVTQPDHAFVAGDLLSLWRRDGLPDHPRRDDLLFAVREHDNGWRETDAAPRVDAATRRPHVFTTLPEEERRDLWWRGVRRFRTERPWACLLITEHARRIHQGRVDTEWQRFDQALGELHDELMEETAGGEGSPERLRAESDLAADYHWLDLADTLSLAACGVAEHVERPGYRAATDGSELRIDPFPLAGSTRFRLPSRTIPDRDYAGDADLGGELAAARWEETILRVAPSRLDLA
jgi:hypothetical protein